MNWENPSANVTSKIKDTPYFLYIKSPIIKNNWPNRLKKFTLLDSWLARSILLTSASTKLTAANIKLIINILFIFSSDDFIFKIYRHQKIEEKYNYYYS